MNLHDTLTKERRLPFEIKQNTFEKIIFIIVCVLCALQLLTIFLGNTLYAASMVNDDSAPAIRHGIEIWKNHSIFLNGWSGVSSLEIDTPAFLFLPIYFLTGKLGLAFGIGYALLYVAEAFVLCDLFRRLGHSWKSGLFVTLLIYTPYCIGELDWSNMLFLVEGQYSFRVFSMLLLMYVAVMSVTEHKSGHMIGAAVVSTLVTFWTSLSCGNYVMLVVFLPILAWSIASSIEKDGFRFLPVQWIVLGLHILAGLLGIYLNHLSGNTVATTENNVIMASLANVNLENCFVGLFMLFGGLNDQDPISVSSFHGIMKVVRIVFPLLLMGFVAAVNIRRKKISSLTAMFLWIAAANLAVLLMTYTRYGASIYEYRYHIVWVVCLMVAVGEFWNEYVNLPLGRCIMSVFLGLCILLNLSGCKNVMVKSTATEPALLLISLAEEQQVGAVFVYDMNPFPQQIRALAPDLYCATVSNYEGTMKVKINDFYYDAADVSTYQGSNLLMMRPEHMEYLSDAQKANYTYVTNIGIYEVYYSEVNLWDGLRGVPVNVTHSVDLPNTLGYSTTGTYLTDGTLLLEQGQVLVGPCSDTIEGTYSITVNYSATGDTDAWLEVTLEDSGEYITCMQLPAGSTTATLSDVTLPDGDKLKLYLTVNDGSAVIQNLEFDKQ